MVVMGFCGSSIAKMQAFSGHTLMWKLGCQTEIEDLAIGILSQGMFSRLEWL